MASESNLDAAKAEFDSLIAQVDPGADSRTGEIAG